MDVHFGGSELTVIGLLLSSVVGALIVIFKLLIVAKDSTIADLTLRVKNLESVATDAVRLMQAAIDKKREIEGQSPTIPIAPVIPEHHSPVTPEQEATAKQATLRAAVVAAALELGLPPTEPDKLVSQAEVIAAIISIPKKEGQS